MSFEVHYMNSKAMDAFNRMCNMYYAEIDRIREETGNAEYNEGWSIIDDREHIRTLEDECSLLVFGYGTDVFNVIGEWEKDDITTVLFTDCNGREYTYDNVREELKTYFDFKEVEL